MSVRSAPRRILLIACSMACGNQIEAHGNDDKVIQSNIGLCRRNVGQCVSGLAPPRIVPAANNSLANRKIYLADNSRLRADADRERVRAEVVLPNSTVWPPEWPSEHFSLPAGHSIADRRAVGLPLDGDQEPGRALRKAWRCDRQVRCDSRRGHAVPWPMHMNPVIAFEIGVAVALGDPGVCLDVARCIPLPVRLAARGRACSDDRIWCGDRGRA